MKNITPRELNALLNGERAPTVIDVRTPAEYQAGHIKGAQNIPLDVIAGASQKLKNGGTVYINCAAGGRSMQACDILARDGVDVINLAGGISAWVQEGFDVV